MTTDIKPSRYVLYIDDEAMAVKHFKDFFGSEFPVLTATTIQEARQIVHQHSQEIAVIVSDQRMPTGNGVELLSELNLKFPEIIRILTTAYASLDSSLEAINHGHIFAYLTKPWDFDSMRAILHSAYREFDKYQAHKSLAASIAHELRTPLSIINGYTTQITDIIPTLQKGYSFTVAQQSPQDPVNSILSVRLPKIAATMQNEVTRSQTIIDLMLASTRTMDKKDFSHLSITACINESLQRYPFTAHDRKLVHTELECEFAFCGMLDMFIFVLFNLLKNSLWAIKTAGQGQITISTFETEHHTVLQFKDTGPGIAADALPHIFEDFYSTRKSSGGTGVGLAFCQRVVHAFGGAIRCESVPGQYTSFMIEFEKTKQTEAVES